MAAWRLKAQVTWSLSFFKLLPIHSERDFENPRLSMWSTTHLVARNNWNQHFGIRICTYVNHLTCAVPDTAHATHSEFRKVQNISYYWTLIVACQTESILKRNSLTLRLQASQEHISSFQWTTTLWTVTQKYYTFDERPYPTIYEYTIITH
jgi:hypothetical protein